MTKIRLYSGTYFDFSNPQPQAIDIKDISAALSKACRFGGHTTEFYSVAEHSVLCARRGLQETGDFTFALKLLLHDGTEAYSGDMVKPLKNLLPQYSEIEKKIERAIGHAFDIDFDVDHDKIKEIDIALFELERKVVFKKRGFFDWLLWRNEINFWKPDKAQREFMSLYEHIQQNRIKNYRW